MSIRGSEGTPKAGALAGAGGDVSRQIQTLQQIGIAGVWIGEEGSYPTSSSAVNNGAGRF